MAAKRSSARKTIGSSPPKGGGRSETSPLAQTSLFQPAFIKLDTPTKSGRRTVLDEASFVEIFITQQGTQVAQMEKFGISYQMLTACRQVYGKKYVAELKRKRAANHSKATKGQVRSVGHSRTGCKHKIKVVLPKERLEELVARGLKDVHIAQALNTTEHHVRRNIKHHDIRRSPELPMCLSRLGPDDLSRLDAMVPGFSKAAAASYVSPQEFFHKLYLAFAQTRLLLEDLKSFGKSLDYYRKLGMVEKDHVTFSMNLAELQLSMALLDSEIPHQRLRCVYKNWAVDFTFPEAMLMVEVDGRFHVTCEVTKSRDERKQKVYTAMGYEILRFTTKEVAEETGRVVSEIESSIQQRSSRSSS